MKYKQIKIIGVEGFSKTFHPNFFICLKKEKMIEKGWKFLVQFFWPAFYKKKKQQQLFFIWTLNIYHLFILTN